MQLTRCLEAVWVAVAGTGAVCAVAVARLGSVGAGVVACTVASVSWVSVAVGSSEGVWVASELLHELTLELLQDK